MALQPFVGPWPLFRFFNPYTVGRSPWTGDQPVARPLPTHRTIQTQNKRTQTSMPRVGLEPTIRVFERMKTVHALDRAATVISVFKSPFSVAQRTHTVFNSNRPCNVGIPILHGHVFQKVYETGRPQT
jgi:hypothetical protein